MVHHGKPWYTMVSWYTYYGIPQYDCHVLWHCRTMIYHSIHHGIPLPSFTMVYYGTPWYTMVHRGIPWCTMVTTAHHGTTMWCYDIVVKWYTMVYTTIYHNLSWCTVVYNGTPWYTTVQLRCVMTLSHHNIPWCTPWYTMDYHVLPWCTVHHGIPRCTMVHHDIPLNDHDVLWHSRLP